MMEDYFCDSRYPAIYRFNLHRENLDDLIELFSKDILQGASSGEVESALVSYITSVVEPVGWKAIWHATKASTNLHFECDFLVEVLDVSLNKLEATVKVLSVFSENCKDLTEVQLIVESHSNTVPLVELYIVSEGDEEQLYLRTASAVEHVRFFYNHIWRPWEEDDDDDNDDPFEKRLRPRIKLFQDIENKVVPSSVAAKVLMILKEGQEIKKRLDELYADMHVDDSDVELSEDDLLQTMKYKMRLVELGREMEMMEYPPMRALVIKNELSQRSPGTNKRNGNAPTVHLVSETFTLSKLRELNLDSNVLLEFHHFLSSAVSNSNAGDKIYIFPGVYTCVGIGWFEKDLTIEGFGDKREIILLSMDAGDIFINTSAVNFEISNVTFHCSSNYHLKSIITVHSGSLALRNCVLESAESADVIITILRNAELVLDNCQLLESMGDGIRVRSGGILKASSSCIRKCKKNGIKIQFSEDVSEEAVAILTDTSVAANSGFGLLVDNVPYPHGSFAMDNEAKDLSELERLPSVNIIIRECSFDSNGCGSYGLRYIDKLPFETSIESIPRYLCKSSSTETTLSFGMSSTNLKKVEETDDVFSSSVIASVVELGLSNSDEEDLDVSSIKAANDSSLEKPSL